MTTDLQIETPRLIIRTVTMADIEDVAQSWQLYDGPITRQEAENQIAQMLSNHQQNRSGRVFHLCLAIIDKETQDFIGWCGLDHRDLTNPYPVLFYPPGVPRLSEVALRRLSSNRRRPVS